MKFLEKIFSIKNKDCCKIITILGLKFKFKSKIKLLSKEIYDLQKRLKKQESQSLKLVDKIRILDREKNLAQWKINLLADFVNCDEIKRRVVEQRFFYNKNYYLPNIDNPKTFNEKILWLREHYLLNNKVTDIISDKLLFKSYISETLGSEYVVPLLGKWENVEDINFDELPNSFVLKSTWGSDDTQVLLVEDKSKLNIEKVRNKLAEWLVPWGNPYYYAYTPVFKNIKPSIIAEEFIKTNDNWMLDDYKFFCFNGKFQLGYVDVRIRGEIGKIYYFDKNWELLPIIHTGHEGDKKHFPNKPKDFEKMVVISEKLAADFPFARVDFFVSNDKLYVGEITFTPSGGFDKLTPIDWDYKMGEMLNISHLVKEKKHV